MDAIKKESVMSRELEIQKLQKEWDTNPRWKGIKRGYTAEDVVRLRGSLQIEHTLAKRGAEKLWSLINNEPFVNALGALTGNQAMQQVKAGLKAIYLSGWQVAGDANSNGERISAAPTETARLFRPITAPGPMTRR